jgi:hypothetical protein
MKSEMDYSEALRGLLKDYFDYKSELELEPDLFKSRLLLGYPTSEAFVRFLRSKENVLSVFGLHFSPVTHYVITPINEHPSGPAHDLQLMLTKNGWKVVA